MTFQSIDGNIYAIPCKCKNCTVFEHCMGGQAIAEADLMRKQMIQAASDQDEPHDVEQIAWERMDANVSPGMAYILALFVKGKTILKRLVGKFAKSDEKETK